MDLSSNQAQRDLLHFGNYSWVIGNGRSIYFWEDRWSGRGVLAQKYNRLYGICKWKFCSIEVIISLFRDLPQYKEMWTRELRDWEKPIALELYELILNIRCNHKEDEDIQSNSKSLKGILALVRGSNLKQAWEIVVSSTFWTYGWQGMKLDTLWKVNPEGCIFLSNKHKRSELFLGWNTSLVGYSDGSFKELENGTMMSGMGGILLNNKDEIIFVFSGKCNSSSPVEAELESIFFLANAAMTHLDHTSKVSIILLQRVVTGLKVVQMVDFVLVDQWWKLSRSWGLSPN
ncbi:hypothetical protein POM88_017133 [Heracleum sosnowskyi]|uniref:Uncharacterized protein n=1 Tax=Heracleum sosnowskyi TaxID=360622 RepID=A0AAD8INK8_9APIA|nr:hypothetical protein POM88_017133 [Heracleum sosnowskyi]